MLQDTQNLVELERQTDQRTLGTDTVEVMSGLTIVGWPCPPGLTCSFAYDLTIYIFYTQLNFALVKCSNLFSQIAQAETLKSEDQFLNTKLPFWHKDNEL